MFSIVSHILTPEQLTVLLITECFLSSSLTVEERSFLRRSVYFDMSKISCGVIFSSPTVTNVSTPPGEVAWYFTCDVYFTTFDTDTRSEIVNGWKPSFFQELFRVMIRPRCLLPRYFVNMVIGRIEVIDVDDGGLLIIRGQDCYVLLVVQKVHYVYLTSFTLPVHGGSNPVTLKTEI